MRSPSWFCLPFLERCEELPWERGQGSVERGHNGNRWDNGLQGLRAEQGTRPSPAPAQQVERSKWRLPPPRADLSTRGWQSPLPKRLAAAPPCLNSTSSLTWPHPAEPSGLRIGCSPGIRTRFLTPAPRSTHLSCGLVSGSGSSGVRLAATRSPASPQTDPAGSRPAATANCACASGRAGGCCSRPGARAAGSTAARDPAAARRPWGCGDPNVRSSLELKLPALQTARFYASRLNWLLDGRTDGRTDLI